MLKSGRSLFAALTPGVGGTLLPAFGLAFISCIFSPCAHYAGDGGNRK